MENSVSKVTRTRTHRFEGCEETNLTVKGHEVREEEEIVTYTMQSPILKG